MIILVAIGLGLIIGWLRKGSLRRLASIDVAAIWIALLALLVRVVLDWGPAWGWDWVRGAQLWLYGAVYALLVLFLVANYRLPGFWLLALGALMNLAVIAANGGIMPVDATGLGANLVHELTSGQVVAHGLISDQTKLKWLADVILVPFPVPKRSSLGDLLMLAGLIYFLQQAMQAQLSYRITSLRQR
ncbi:MAG: DUF5317 domain-containing protein [Clostridia bacterium]|nr:DUF5317 domain-containing protein [Clostridia bacterium]